MFVQNRWVQDSGVQAAVIDAYRNLLMQGEYPVVAVWVHCAPDEVDVNIHPTKSQVKFRQASDSFKSVSRAVRSCLEGALGLMIWSLVQLASRETLGPINGS